MSPNLTQPEEIEQVTKEMEQCSLTKDELTNKKPASQAIKHTGKLSAYRAEYIKAHGLDEK